ncbi:MAG TPA: biotin/lipoyl-containing protein [Candidatus Baltobacteraceae bacterium]
MASLKITPATWDAALDRVREAAAACVGHDLLRVRIDEPAFALEVRRSRHVAAASEVYNAAGASGEHQAYDLGAVSTNGVVHEPEPVIVKADLVGVVRLSKPLVVEGSPVNEERELAYVEALGTRNPVRAAGRGTVRSVLVSDGQPVEFGHPLFSIAYE